MNILYVSLSRVLGAVALLACLAQPAAAQGTLPFTTDFEDGTLRGWTQTGTAFRHQPTLGDNPTARNRGQPSRHQGRYWIGGYEKFQGRPGEQPGAVQGDHPEGTLTSAPFTIGYQSLSFLIGGGSGDSTRVELLVNGVPQLKASGRNHETMHRVTWDLGPYVGQNGSLRIVDQSSSGWGHINVDDFRFAGATGGGTSAAFGNPCAPTVAAGAGNAFWNTRWQFGRGNGSVIASEIVLQPGGGISGYSHPNESRWAATAAGHLVFCRNDGTPSVIYDRESIDASGRRVLNGVFLNPNGSRGGFDHVLISRAAGTYTVPGGGGGAVSPVGDLTGRWRGNDGGTYYLRQLGETIWWLGVSADDGSHWTNVFHGRIQGNRIVGTWSDVPRGRVMGHGDMEVRIDSGNALTAIRKTGGFGGSAWSR